MEVKHVAITLKSDNNVLVMQFVLNVRPDFRQEPTRENVQAEIDRQPYAADVKSWRFVELADLPQSLEDRGVNWQKWRDDGKTVRVVDD